MSKKLSFDLEMNAQGFKQGINEAKSATAEYTNATRDLKKETDDYLKSFGSLRKQFGAAKKEAQNLAAQFNALSDAEKNTEFGQELAQSLDIAIRKAAELQDVMADTNQAIKNASSDTQGMDAIKDALDIGKDLATAYAGAVAKMTNNEKAYKDMLANVAMIQGGFNATIKTFNALQPQSNLLLAIGNIQLKAKAIAETLATKTTKGATAAQRVFNAVAKANPYVLLATAAIAAATAIGGYMLATKKANAEEEKHKKELEEVKEAQDAYTNSFKNTATNLITKYRELQASWNKLKTELEKTQFIKKHVNDFKELGGSVKTVNDANDFLVKQTKQVEAALMARAKSAAYAAQAQALYGQGIQKSIELEELYQKKLKAYSEIKGDKKETITVSSPTTGGSYSFTITKTVREQLQEIDDMFADEEKRLQDGMEDAFRKADSLIKKGADLVKDIPSIGDSKTDVQIKTRYEKLKKAVSDVEKEIENLDENAPNFKELYDNLQEKLYKAQQALENFERTHGMIKIDIQFPDTKELADRLKKKIKDLIDAANKEAEKNVIKIKTEFEQTTNTPIREQTINNIMDKALNSDKFKSPDYDKILNVPSMERAGEKLIKQRDAILDAVGSINKQFGNTEEGKKALAILEKEYKNVTDQLDVMLEKSEKIAEQQLKFEGAKASIKTLGQLNNAVSNLHDTWASLSENWDDMSAFEKITKTFEAVISTIEEVISAYESINSVIELFGDISEAAAAKKIAANAAEATSDTTTTAIETANSEVKVTANETEKASDMGKLGVKEAGAIAGATESGSSLPFPANLVAIAAGIAAVVAAFAMVFSCFAEGGIVPGNSFQGDKVMARLNSGEMVLNSRQQKRLFDIANGIQGGAYAAQTVSIEGKIRGKDLLLVQKNTNTINSVAGQSIKIQ